MCLIQILYFLLKDTYSHAKNQARLCHIKINNVLLNRAYSEEKIFQQQRQLSELEHHFEQQQTEKCDSNAQMEELQRKQDELENHIEEKQRKQNELEDLIEQQQLEIRYIFSFKFRSYEAKYSKLRRHNISPHLSVLLHI